MPDEYWITGVYWCDEMTDENTEENNAKHGNSFAYGPFPTQEECVAVADDDAHMLKTLGGTNTTYEIDCTDPLTYGQACKHFWETIMSKHWVEFDKRLEAAS